MKIFKSSKQTIVLSKTDAFKVYFNTHSSVTRDTLATIVYHIDKINEYRRICEKAVNDNMSITYNRYRSLASDSLRLICLEAAILSDKVERYTGTSLGFSVAEGSFEAKYNEVKDFINLLYRAANLDVLENAI